MGNIHGRYEPANSTRDALLIGSHMVSLLSSIRLFQCFDRDPILRQLIRFSLFKKQDTVVDAGMYDGALGIISAISALKVLKVTGKLQRLTRPVEVREFSTASSILQMLL